MRTIENKVLARVFTRLIEPQTGTLLFSFPQVYSGNACIVCECVSERHKKVKDTFFVVWFNQGIIVE